MKYLSTLLVALLLFGCSAPTVQAPNEEEPEQEDIVVRVEAVGDNLIHSTVYEDALQSDGSYDFTNMYQHVKSMIETADLAFINQETMIGGTSLGLSGYPSFNTPEGMVKSLYQTGFDLINLATNHTLDRGQVAINNTLDFLSAYPEMVATGAYDSQAAYDTIPTITKNGITFSLLAYTYGTNGIQAPYNYSVRYFDEALIREDVEKAKAISDVVLVSAHWGDENSFIPNTMQTKYAQLFADLGVDVVIGTHPHVIQPVEQLTGIEGNTTLVAYSLGNFMGGMLQVNNAINGMLGFDVVKDASTNEITIENITWEPLIIHFEGVQSDILAQRYNYASYPVKNYSDELASKHVLNGYDGQVVSLDLINQITSQVIAQQYLD
ncbi:MAG: CapA family protein [Erysipelotrichaceae bacterium]